MLKKKLIKIKLQRFLENLGQIDLRKVSRFLERFKQKDWEKQSRNMILGHEVKRFGKVFKDNLVTLLISAFGLVAALSWNDAIRAWLETVIPEKTVAYRFYTAIFISFLSVLVTYFVSRLRGE
jgi:hypothetical protein